MTQYNPDRWVVLKMIHNGTTLHKVLGHWHGGYLNGDSWRLNSGITHVESVPGFYRFHGSSGSIQLPPGGVWSDHDDLRDRR